MDTLRKSEQHVPGEPAEGSPRQRRWDCMGKASRALHIAMEPLGLCWQAIVRWKFVVMYLAAIVAANLGLAWFTTVFGTEPKTLAIATTFNAFAWIGLDLTSRDNLHEAWQGKHLWWKMLVLVYTGSLLSYLLNQDAGLIAVASFVAFLSAGATDTVVYSVARHLGYTRWGRVQASNAFAALVDSLVFPWLAFGTVSPVVVLPMFLAKVLGGWAWALLLVRRAGTQEENHP